MPPDPDICQIKGCGKELVAKGHALVCPTNLPSHTVRVKCTDELHAAFIDYDTMHPRFGKGYHLLNNTEASPRAY